MKLCCSFWKSNEEEKELINLSDKQSEIFQIQEPFSTRVVNQIKNFSFDACLDQTTQKIDAVQDKCAPYVIPIWYSAVLGNFFSGINAAFWMAAFNVTTDTARTAYLASLPVTVPITYLVSYDLNREESFIKNQLNHLKEKVTECLSSRSNAL